MNFYMIKFFARILPRYFPIILSRAHKTKGKPMAVTCKDTKVFIIYHVSKHTIPSRILLGTKLFKLRLKTKTFLIHLCPVHLSGKNILCTDKKFCPKLKSTYLLVKWMENDFLATDKILSTAKKLFPFHEQI